MNIPRQIIIVIFMIGSACPVLAKSVECQVDETIENGAKIHVPVTITAGAQAAVHQPTLFKGQTFSARWVKGDKYESQAVFSMIYDDLTSNMYDFSLDGHVGPINSMWKGNIRFQCWVAG